MLAIYSLGTTYDFQEAREQKKQKVAAKKAKKDAKKEFKKNAKMALTPQDLKSVMARLEAYEKEQAVSN